eukprot:979709-Pleurochrysis_carterae.AAC.1
MITAGETYSSLFLSHLRPYPQKAPFALTLIPAHKIRAAARSARAIYLATDPDREGEAIAWHVLQLLHADADVPAEVTPQRISFNEITRPAVEAALKSAGTIDMPLVKVQRERESESAHVRPCVCVCQTERESV